MAGKEKKQFSSRSDHGNNNAVGKDGRIFLGKLRVKSRVVEKRRFSLSIQAGSTKTTPNIFPFFSSRLFFFVFFYFVLQDAIGGMTLMLCQIYSVA